LKTENPDHIGELIRGYGDQRIHVFIPNRNPFFKGMTNYRNGPTTDHSGVVFDYNGLVLDRVAYFGTSYSISEP